MTSTAKMNTKFQFAIDRGGTFTDVYARCPGGKIRLLKLLSVDPANYPDAPREGIRRILEQETGEKFPANQPIETKHIDWIRMGTTVATNALLERKGERMALIITKGFRDLLYIGNQARPNLFDLEIVMPEMLYEEVIEVDERVIVTQGRCRMDTSSLKEVIGTTGEKLLVKKDLDVQNLKEVLMKVRNKGINSLAVVLMHSYTFQDHELKIGEIAKQIGFQHVSLSSQIMPMVKIVPRGFTASVDAYLTPLIKKYVEGFSSGFKDSLKDVNVLFMQSDGGLTSMNTFFGSRAILSGPAGGVVGYSKTSYDGKSPVIGFDMGGTSTDVSRFAGEFEHVFETTTAGVTIQAPQLDVNTVAAGGGSMLFFRSGLFVVGPESASAHPGPVCYKKGGPLAVTDANLLLGRLLPEYFPHIFGLTEKEPLDKDATSAAFEIMTKNVNDFLGKDKKMTAEEVAMGFIHVANESMCRPIRALTQGRGYDTARHVLSCFGGAGGQHACAIAQNLGISTVFIHKYAGILSAYGIACADVVEDVQEPCAKTYSSENFNYLDERIHVLEKQCRSELEKQGFPVAMVEVQPFLHLRYEGTDCALMCPASKDSAQPGTTSKYGDFMKVFLNRYKSEFGFTIADRHIFVDDIRIRGTGKTDIPPDQEMAATTNQPVHEKVTKTYFEEGYLDTHIYFLEKLKYGHKVSGPAIIIDDLSTILVEPNCSADITSHGDVIIHVTNSGRKNIGTTLDSIQLSIFSHRFMSIAEQMGRVLQRTSISTNIKERLDFSCALFGPDGGLISNAPHIPVHLGAMQETVQFQMKIREHDIKKGDVLLCNHPSCGGSHLPDLTVITPVFLEDAAKPTFFVANRGHHADIGGTTPGSMPAHSKALSEEGACFKSFKLVDGGVFQEEALIDSLNAPGKIPGSSATRNLKDNLADLHAQIAANHKGVNLVGELIEEYGLEVVLAYMGHIQQNAEVAVRDVLKEFGKKTLLRTGKSQLEAVEYMDDGTPIKLTVSINPDEGTAVMDFTGTGYEVWGNCNAPRAITLSALIYCLRSLVGQDIPLNQGCLKPIELIVPKGSILDPSEVSAVVGGNVLTSQRITDVIFKAFSTCAASQGCMNNITFGDETLGYYETVGGGSGAGPTWHGRSGVHCHMTNTRITDPEILELRYPIILNTFGINPGSGGRGLYNGGDGVRRELIFRKDIVLSILTERRAFQPYGMNGGEPGQRGLNLVFKTDGRIINIGGKACIPVGPGDMFRLLSPGGGGYGVPSDDVTVNEKKKNQATFIPRGSVHEYKRAQESV